MNDLKTIVDSGELKLRGGEAVSASLQGGLKAWDTTKTGAQVANVVIETGLGTKSIGDAIVEWKKEHYFCCVCLGAAYFCFYIAAAANLIPGGYGFWKGASKAGAVSQGVTGIRRKITGGHEL